MSEAAQTKSASRRVGLKLWPDSLFGRLSLINALREERRLPQAKAMLDDIPTPEGESWNAYFFHSLHGALALAQGKIDKAYESMQKALTIYPDGDTRFVMGVILQERGQLRQAREEYRHALRSGLSPDGVDLVRRRIVQINEQIGFEPVAVDASAGEGAP